MPFCWKPLVLVQMYGMQINPDSDTPLILKISWVIFFLLVLGHSDVCVHECMLAEYVGVCTSGSHADLKKTDEIAGKIIKQLMAVQGLDKRVQQQYSDNLNWILSVEKHQLVVGSEARILYSNAEVCWIL